MKLKTRSMESAALWRALVMSREKLKGGDLTAWGQCLDLVRAEYEAAVAITNALPVGSSARNALADTIDSVGQQLVEDLAAYISQVEDYTKELGARSGA
jgi:hypothetical protein